MIDKREHRERYSVWRFNPYHYCLTALMERYVMWLKLHGEIGDVVAEPRYKLADKKLKRAFQYIWANGTDNVTAKEVQACITSRELKFQAKMTNDCGLQLVELIANASHRGTKARQLGEPFRDAFGGKVYEILEKKKFRRHPKTMKIDGYGRKWLP